MVCLSNTYFRLLPRSFSTCKSLRRIEREMVTPRFIAAELLKKRKEDKIRGKNTILNSAEIQVVGSYCQGHRPSLLVNSEGCAYLFNCCEGTQRNFYANKVKLLNLSHLFITNQHWPNVSGAFGLSLTLQDVGAPNFTIHGTEALSDFFGSVRSFLSFTSGIDCKIRVCDDNEYKDSCITIKSVILNKANGAEGGESSHKRIKTAPQLISYVCTLPDLPGALDPQKCREMGVPIGPKLAVLKSGQDITLDDGTIVKSIDVCSAKNKGLRFIIMDCPTIGDIDLVIKNEFLKLCQNREKPADDRQVDIVFHFSPKEVCDDQRYKEWMNGFSVNCKHVLLANSQPARPNFIDSYRFSYLLNKLDEDIFPSLNLPKHFDSQIQRELKSETTSEYGTPASDDLEIKYENKGHISHQERVIMASTLDKWVIRPNSGFLSPESRIIVDAPFKSASVMPDFDEEFKAYESWRKAQPVPAAYEPEIVFLGTGSALPSRLRNTSCILVNMVVPKKASIMMDCGEDSYGQLIRFYGEDKTNEFLRNLKVIYISHHHADHHIGLIEILRRVKLVARDQPVVLLAPPGIERQLNYYNDNFEDLNSVYHLISTKLLRLKPTKGHLGDKAIDSMVGLIRSKSGNLVRDVKVVGVDHCANSCAVMMELNINRPQMNTFKISYSGDARPSEDFAIIGRGCDLLIHEATFDHRELQSALEKKHCTTTEAIEMAKKMEAKYTLLTHFSQRYPKIPYFTSAFDETIGYAFDNMALRCPSHNARLPQMKKLMSNTFSKSLHEIDARYMKMMERRKMIGDLVSSNDSRN